MKADAEVASRHPLRSVEDPVKVARTLDSTSIREYTARYCPEVGIQYCFSSGADKRVEIGRKADASDSSADSGRSGALIPFEVGQRSAAMWGRIPLGSGALFGR